MWTDFHISAALWLGRLRLLAILALPWLSQCASAASTSGAPPLNVVFILADDLGWGELGCYGQQKIPTPHLDRLAAQGMRFTRHYSGAPVCAPSRCVLLTGRHLGHAEIRGNLQAQTAFPQFNEGQYPLSSEALTVAQVFRKAGYATGAIGKWGLGPVGSTGDPNTKGFDLFFGYNCQRHAHSYFPTFLYRDDRRIELPGNDGVGVGPIYAQDLIQREVLDWVRAQRDRPFFLFYAITLPHGRFEINDVGEYRDRPWTDQQKAFAAMVTRLGRDIGQLLDLLAEMGIEGRTLVMTSGDNGSSFNPDSEFGRLFNQAGNGLRGYKRGLYEGALRQASIVRWPGVVPAGRVAEAPWAFWDFLPTAAELAGATLPAGFRPDGRSIVEYLRGGAAPSRDYFYWELHEQQPIQAARWGDWKAVRNGIDRPIEIYDLARDAGETRDLAATRPDLVARAEEILRTARVPDRNWPLEGRAAHRSGGATKGKAAKK